MLEIFDSCGSDVLLQKQALFASIFVMQNRLQTAAERVQTEISMKQWLLLAMTQACIKEPTLTNIGHLMGCSRQNVKKLALALQKKGFITFKKGKSNSLEIGLTTKVQQYSIQMQVRHTEVLRLLFDEFNDEEINNLFHLYEKLFSGIHQVENYTREDEYEED